MLAPRSRCVLLAAPLVLLAACGGAAPPLESSFDAPADAAKLVPADAVAVFALESFDAASSVVEAGGGEPLDVGELLGMLPGADAAAVARDAPVLLALRLDPAQPYPLPVWILPTDDADAFVAGLLPGAGIVHERSGAYVAAAPNGEGYASGGATDLDLPGGVFAAHVDLAALVEAFRPLIDTGLAQFEDQMSMVADMQAQQGAPAGMDVEAVMELYVEWARDLLDSADTLEMTVWRDGDRVNADGALALLAGSPWAGLVDGPPIAVGDALAHLDETAALTMVGAIDWGSMYEHLQPFMDSLVEGYPEELREPMGRIYAASSALYDGMSGPMAISMDFGPGIRMTGWNASPDAGEYLERYAEAVEPLREGVGGITVEGPTVVEVDGRAATELRFAYGPEFMEAVMGGSSDPAAREMVETMFGGAEGTQMRMAAVGEDIVWVFGGGELGAVAARRPGVAPDLEALVERVGPAAALMAMRIDVAAFAESVTALVPLPPGEAPPSMDMGPVLLYGAGEAQRWRFGASLDLAGLGRTVQAQGR